MQPELQAIVGHEATQPMRFETEHRGYRDMVSVRADCLDAAVAGWKRRGVSADQRHGIDTINNVFDIAQKPSPLYLRTPMLDLSAELKGYCAADMKAEVLARACADDTPVPVEVQTFESTFGKSRVVMFSDGTPWFVAKDVCEGLGLSAGSMSTQMDRLKDQQKQVLNVSSCSTAGIGEELYGGRGAPRITLFSRGGFNDLILESRKPIPREYRQWVTDTVLPDLYG